MTTTICRERRQEMMVGGFAVLILAGLFVFSIFITGDLFWKKQATVDVVFDQVMGLRKGDNVVVRGMTVGEVRSLRMVPETGRILVSCRLTQPVALRRDCSATVASTSVLGGRNLVLKEGSVAEDPFPAGQPIPGIPPADLMEDLGKIFQEIRSSMETNGILDQVADTMKSLREITDKVNSGRGTLGMLVNDPALYKDLSAAVADVRSMTAQMRQGNGSLGKLLSRDEAYNDIAASLANVREITQRVKEGKGFLGKILAEDDTLYTDTKSLLQDVRAAVDDYRESSPILTFTSILFGAF